MERRTQRRLMPAVTAAAMLLPACALAAGAPPVPDDYSFGTVMAGFACGLMLGGGVLVLAAPLCAHFLYRVMDET